MFLILAMIATSFVAPIHDGEIDAGNWQVNLTGTVTWMEAAPGVPAEALVTVRAGGQIIGEETVFWSGGDYWITLGYENTVYDRYAVTCTWIIGSPPYLVSVETIYWPEDFVFTMPMKYWVCTLDFGPRI